LTAVGRRGGHGGDKNVMTAQDSRVRGTKVPARRRADYQEVSLPPSPPGERSTEPVHMYGPSGGEGAAKRWHRSRRANFSAANGGGNGDGDGGGGLPPLGRCSPRLHY